MKTYSRNYPEMSSKTVFIKRKAVAKFLKYNSFHMNKIG